MLSKPRFQIMLIEWQSVSSIVKGVQSHCLLCFLMPHVRSLPHKHVESIHICFLYFPLHLRTDEITLANTLDTI